MGGSLIMCLPVPLRILVVRFVAPYTLSNLGRSSRRPEEVGTKGSPYRRGRKPNAPGRILRAGRKTAPI